MSDTVPHRDLSLSTVPNDRLLAIQCNFYESRPSAVFFTAVLSEARVFCTSDMQSERGTNWTLSFLLKFEIVTCEYWLLQG